MTDYPYLFAVYDNFVPPSYGVRTTDGGFIRSLCYFRLHRMATFAPHRTGFVLLL